MLVPLLGMMACSDRDARAPEGPSGPAAPPFANVRIAGAGAAPAPDGVETGRFARDGDCLLFVTDGGGAYNPVIAGEASIIRTRSGDPAVMLGGETIALGRRIRVGGGGSGEVTLTGAQRACSGSIFVIGEILDRQ